MKIYTRTGDGGETGLFGSERVPKDDARVSAYGSVDEANAALGLARAELARCQATARDAAAGLDADLEALQSRLFDVGSDLATPLTARQRDMIRSIDALDVTALEDIIDRYDAELPRLTNFVLPGGSATAAALHLARGIVRRAEREAVTAARTAGINPEAVKFLNRLSDLLFTLARAANARAGVAESVWRGRGS